MARVVFSCHSHTGLRYMKNIIKIEIYKFFHCKPFYITLCIAVLIVCLDVFQNYLLVNSYINTVDVSTFGYQSINLFIRWIGINQDTIGYLVFYNTIPLLVAIPFGWSYAVECKGYTNQVITRTSKFAYLVSKYIAVFISGGLVVSVPLILNFGLNALVCPAAIPDVTSLLVPMYQGSFLSYVFYSNPCMHTLLVIIMSFCWGGAVACIALSVSVCLKKVILSVLSPFVILYSIELFTVTFIIEDTDQIQYVFSPLSQVHATTYNANPSWLVFGTIVLIATISFFCTIIRGVRNEV